MNITQAKRRAVELLEDDGKLLGVCMHRDRGDGGPCDHCHGDGSGNEGVTYTEHSLLGHTSDWYAVARTLMERGFDAKISDDGFVITDAPLAQVRDVIAAHVDTSGT